MTNNKEKLLNKIKNSVRRAVLPGIETAHPGSFQGYSYRPDAPTKTLVEQFRQELEKLSGYVYLLDDVEETVPTILEILRKHQAGKIIAWDQDDVELPWLPPALTEAGITIAASHLGPDEASRKATLAQIDDVRVGLTGVQGGLADTGALALISGPGRGRLPSLLPPIHIALLPANKLYPSLPAFLAANPTATGEGSNLVFIAGPSRTGDIEMTLSMGVHGPGKVYVIIIP